MEKPAYRTGLVCTVDGVDYWHTGAQYWLSHSPDETHQFDLREIPGFKRVEAEFDGYTRLFYSQRWKVAGQRNAAIRQSVEMLREHADQLWWEAVSDFLQARHLESAPRTRAIRALGSGDCPTRKFVISCRTLRFQRPIYIASSANGTRSFKQSMLSSSTRRKKRETRTSPTPYRERSVSSVGLLRLVAKRRGVAFPENQEPRRLERSTSLDDDVALQWQCLRVAASYLPRCRGGVARDGNE